MWDLDQGTEIRNLVGNTEGVTSVAFSPNGKFIASGSEDSIIKSWCLDDDNQLRNTKGHSKPIRSISVSSDGKYFASGSDDNLVIIWNI